MSGTHSATESAGVQHDQPASLHLVNISESPDDRDGEHVEPIPDLQDLSGKSVGGV